MKVRKEPRRLKSGKAFHKRVQKEWLATAEGKIRSERGIRQTDGRKGRLDILVEDLGDNLVSVVEIKNTDWDRIRAANIRRNAKRQARQIWGYIDSQIALYGKEVCAGVIFPKFPKKPDRVRRVEDLFHDAQIQVVWQNETIEDLRARVSDASRKPSGS